MIDFCKTRELLKTRNSIKNVVDNFTEEAKSGKLLLKYFYFKDTSKSKLTKTTRIITCLSILDKNNKVHIMSISPLSETDTFVKIQGRYSVIQRFLTSTNHKFIKTTTWSGDSAKDLLDFIKELDNKKCLPTRYKNFKSIKPNSKFASQTLKRMI